jgi:hypothetical protein
MVRCCGKAEANASPRRWARDGPLVSHGCLGDQLVQSVGLCDGRIAFGHHSGVVGLETRQSFGDTLKDWRLGAAA